MRALLPLCALALLLAGALAHDCLDAAPIVGGGAKGAAADVGGNDPTPDLVADDFFLQVEASGQRARRNGKEPRDVEGSLAPLVLAELEAQAQTRITFTAHKLLAAAPAWLTFPLGAGALAWPAMPGGVYAAGSHHAYVAALNNARTFAHATFQPLAAGTLEARARVDTDVFLMALVNAFNHNGAGYAAVHLHPELHVAGTNWRNTLWGAAPAVAPVAAPGGQDQVSGFIDYAITNAAGTVIYMVIEVKAYNHAELADGSGRRQAAMEAAHAMSLNHAAAGLHPVPFVLTDGDDFYFYQLTRGATTLEVREYGTYRASNGFNSIRNIFLRLRLLLTHSRHTIGV